MQHILLEHSIVFCWIITKRKRRTNTQMQRINEQRIWNKYKSILVFNVVNWHYLFWNYFNPKHKFYHFEFVQPERRYPTYGWTGLPEKRSILASSSQLVKEHRKTALFVLSLVRSHVSIPDFLKRPPQQKKKKKASVRLNVTWEYVLASCIRCSRYVRECY